MTQDNINLHPLLKQITKKYRTYDGQPLNFSEVVSLKFITDESRTMFITHRLNFASYKVLIGKRGRPMIRNIEKSYKPLQIDMKNVRCLLPYI